MTKFMIPTNLRLGHFPSRPEVNIVIEMLKFRGDIIEVDSKNDLGMGRVRYKGYSWVLADLIPLKPTIKQL